MPLVPMATGVKMSLVANRGSFLDRFLSSTCSATMPTPVEAKVEYEGVSPIQGVFPSSIPYY